MKKTFLLFLLYPLLNFSQANKYVRQALRLQNPKQQIELLDQALSIDAKHLDALFYRAIAKYNLGDFDAAILDFTKVIFYEPDADSYYNRGNCKFNLNDFQGALLDYEEALKLDPDLITAYFNLGKVKYNLQQYEDAEIAFSKVIRAFPSDVKSYSQRALVYMKQKKYDLAFKDFTACILLRPSSKSYYNRGYAYLEINHYKTSRADFMKALRINSQNIPAYFYLGVNQILLGEYEAAIQSLSKSTLKDTNDYDAFIGLAIAHYKRNEFKLAKMHLVKAKNILTSTQKNMSISIFKETYWGVNEKVLLHETYNALAKS